MDKGQSDLGDYVEFVEEKVVPPFLLASALLSIADRIWRVLPAGWGLPLEFFVLFLLLRWLGEVRKKVRLVTADAPVRHYPDYVSFYAALERAVAGAKATVLATYEQATPPTLDVEEAGAYFDHALAWARYKPGARTFQRLIRVPRGNAALAAWADEQACLAEGIRNYDVAIETAERTKRDGASFVVIDGSAVFVAFFMGSRQEIRSHSIHSESVARDYQELFRDRWTNAARPDGGHRPPRPGQLRCGGHSHQPPPSGADKAIIISGTAARPNRNTDPTTRGPGGQSRTGLVARREPSRPSRSVTAV